MSHRSGMSDRRSLASAIGAALVIVACAEGGREDATPAADTSPSASQPAQARPEPGQFSRQDFARLRWLEGSWRGRLPDGKYFHERYHFLDDSTIAMHGFADSTFASATDSSRITLRGQTIANEGAAARWVATTLDSSSVSFAPDRGASNHFVWSRESRDRWTATLRSAGEPPRLTVYQMERVRR